jgi:hypothetical protein
VRRFFETVLIVDLYTVVYRQQSRGRVRPHFRQSYPESAGKNVWQGCIQPYVAAYNSFSMLGPTCWNIAAHLTSASHRFYTNIECTLLGKKPTPAEREEVWSSMVFSNFVQQIVGYGPTARPTPHMWAGGHPAFRSLLAALQPDVVLVFGFELWDKLPGGYRALEAVQAGNITLQRRAYGHTIACRVRHPSSPGFSSRAWHQVITRAMQAPS